MGRHNWLCWGECLKPLSNPFGRQKPFFLVTQFLNLAFMFTVINIDKHKKVLRFCILQSAWLIQRSTVRTDPLHYLLQPKTVHLKVIILVMGLLQDFCTAKPNPALVSSGEELDSTGLTEQDCEGRFRVYSGMQYSHISTGRESLYNESRPHSECVYFDWKEDQ